MPQLGGCITQRNTNETLNIGIAKAKLARSLLYVNALLNPVPGGYKAVFHLIPQ